MNKEVITKYNNVIIKWTSIHVISLNRCEILKGILSLAHAYTREQEHNHYD